jgi:hypothetical protein
VSQLDGSCNPPSTATRIVISGNRISDNAVENQSGWGDGTGYEAGVSDSGRSDTIKKNTICGAGYRPVGPPPHLYFIDTTFTNHPITVNNKKKNTC